MSTYNLNPILNPIIHCVPAEEPNPETGCRACGDNARSEYEQCQQAYYLKKQTELFESQQKSQNIVIEKEQIITEKEEVIDELELKNLKLQGTLDEQIIEIQEKLDKQIEESDYKTEEQDQTINALIASLEQKTNSLNIACSAILLIILFFLILTLIKKWKK